MPTPTKGPRLGGGPAHERLMLANLATALFEHGQITTTQAKAKRVQPLAERMITFAKRGDLHSRRRVMTVIRDKSVVHELFTEIGPRFETRNGGYTRITKIGPRKGDNAPMAIIELCEPLTEQAIAEAEAAAKRAAKQRQAREEAAAAAAKPKAEETAVEETSAADSAAEDTASETDVVEEALDETPVAAEESETETDVEPADEAPADEAEGDDKK